MTNSMADYLQLNAADTVRILFAELESILSDDVNHFANAVPSSYLVDAIDEWADKLHAAGYLSDSDKENAKELVAEGRKRLNDW